MIGSITLRNVRVYQEVRTAFSGGISVFFGPNGVGKTSLVEAVYLLATVRSFRTGHLGDLLRKDEREGVVEGHVLDPDHVLRIELTSHGRRLRRDGKAVRSAAAFCRDFSVVALSPEHLALVSGPPEERRRFMDRTLFSRDPAFADVALRYREALKQKQALLRSGLTFTSYRDQVEPWNRELAESGTALRIQREVLVETLRTPVAERYRRLAGGEGDVELHPVLAGDDLHRDLEVRAAAEFGAQRALVGPHRDDLEIRLNGRRASEVASQGERASILLALKWAEIEAIDRVRPGPVTLLLDDLGATLDSERRKRLFDLLSADPHQALVTTSDRSVFDLALASGAQEFRRVASDRGEGFSIAQWVAA